MPPDKAIRWGIRDTGLYIEINGIEEIVIPPAQYPSLILTLVGELKRSLGKREGR